MNVTFYLAFTLGMELIGVTQQSKYMCGFCLLVLGARTLGAREETTAGTRKTAGETKRTRETERRRASERDRKERGKDMTK